MSGFAVKGWCPDAWRPMMAGDGLLVRVKPRLGVLTRAQVLDVCEAALTHGNGLIDLTGRANLQLRGVREADCPSLIERLVASGLVDGDPAREARRNVLVAPDWQADDATHCVASELLARVDELPQLPGKAGFVVDAGPACLLADEAGDFRIERSEAGGLILRADGRARGVTVAPERVVDALIALARWFVTSGGTTSGGMARHNAGLPEWARGDIAPAASRARIKPGRHDLGASYGVAFGRIEAEALAKALENSSISAVRFTPWRVMILEGASAGPVPDLLHDPTDPLLHADACPGAPGCPQATVETRDLARALAPVVPGRLHVSGCAKGCARPSAADVVLTGANARFDPAFASRAGEPPARAGLTRDDLLHHFGAA